MKSLSEAAVQQYRELGYYAPVPVLSRPEAAALRQNLEAFEATGDGMQGPIRHKPHLLFTWLVIEMKNAKQYDKDLYEF